MYNASAPKRRTKKPPPRCAACSATLSISPLKTNPAPRYVPAHSSTPQASNSNHRVGRRPKERERRTRHTNVAPKRLTKQNDLAVVQQEFESTVHLSGVPYRHLS